MGVTYGGKAAVDPLALLDQCYEKNVPPDVWRGRANYFVCPAGREPGRGGVLLLQSDLAALDLTVSQNLIFDDGATTKTLKKIAATRYQCVTPGAEADPNAVYLVELADRRLFAARTVINAAFNLRTTTDGNYAPTTLNGSIPWTWTQLVETLWNAVTAAVGIGSYPGLPFSPGGVPEGWDFFGGNAWAALNDVLEKIGCSITYDPATDAFGIVRLGKDTSEATSALGSLAQRDRTWEDYGADPRRGWWPEKIRVLFRVFPPPLRGDSPWVAETVSPGMPAGVEPGTTVTLYDDLAATGFNGTALALRAVERAADWLRIRENYVSPFTQSVVGVFGDLPKTVGPEVAQWAIRDLGPGGLQSEVSAGKENPVDSFLLDALFCCTPPGYPNPSRGHPIPSSRVVFKTDLNPRCSGGHIVYDRVWVTHVIAGGILMQFLSDTDPDAPPPQSWWCTDGGCVQSADPPEGFLDGPFETEEECTGACV